MPVVKPRPPRASLYRPLDEPHQRELAAEIGHSLRMSQKKNDVLADVHVRLLDRVLFRRWSAGGLNAHGVVSANGVEHNCYVLRHSQAAEDVWNELKQPRRVPQMRKDGRPYLVHDLAVPKKVLLAKLGPLSGDNDVVFATMRALCHAAVITPEEGDALKAAGFEEAMPPDWDGENPWRRYDGIVVLKPPVKPPPQL
jgi:hypothetical protein